MDVCYAFDILASHSIIVALGFYSQEICSILVRMFYHSLSKIKDLLHPMGVKLGSFTPIVQVHSSGKAVKGLGSYERCLNSGQEVA